MTTSAWSVDPRSLKRMRERRLAQLVKDNAPDRLIDVEMLMITCADILIRHQERGDSERAAHASVRRALEYLGDPGEIGDQIGPAPP